MLKIIKKLFSRATQEQEDVVRQQAIENEQAQAAMSETKPPQMTRVQARTALVFDAKKRIFITKRKISTVALWCSDKQQIIAMNEAGEQQVIPVALHKEEESALPVSGCWTENSAAGVGFYFPTRALFQLKDDIFAQQATDDFLFTFGPHAKDWQPIAGDWNSDGVATIGLYDKERAKFLLQNQHKGGIKSDLDFNFGPRNSNWTPIAGDWNGDGQCTVGLYDADHGVAMLQNQHRGSVQPDIRYKILGVQPHWQPVVGDWENAGIDSLAFWDAQTEQIHFKYANSNGGIDKVLDMPCGQEKVVPLAILNLLA